MIVAVSTRHVDANARTRAHARRVAAATAQNAPVKNERARLQGRSGALPWPSGPKTRHAIEAVQAAEKDGQAARADRRQARLQQIERFLLRYGSSRHAAGAAPLRRRERPSLRQVAARVCRTFGVSLEELKSDRRQSDLVLAKQAFAFWAYTYTGQSLPAIGRFIGCDHTTILYSIRVFPEKRRLRKEKQLAARKALAAIRAPAEKEHSHADD